MEPLWLIAAFVFGFAAKQLKLPPLIGFLIAGFLLNYFGVEKSIVLEEISNIGVFLLLFTIGLKLKIKNLLHPEIWATASLHMLIIVLLFVSIISLLTAISFPMFATQGFQTSMIIAFALSFSSTVFVVKILEEKGESNSPFGRISVGILIIQDVFAIIFILFSSHKTPDLSALYLLLLLLVPILLKRKSFFDLFNSVGHGELLVLLGLLLPISVAYLFENFGLKADFGALVIGVLISNHPKGEEISDLLLNFKDLFLVGFFLTIGLSGIPSFTTLGIAIIFVLLLPIKTFFFYFLLTRFNLRARTSSFISLGLTNYSEFGLIIGIIATKTGYINEEWLIIFALAMAISFLLSAPLNAYSHKIYVRYRAWLKMLESPKRLPYEMPINYGDAKVIVLGMGRMGTSVYDVLTNRLDGKILGIEQDELVVENHLKNYRNVMLRDATDIDFWERVCKVNTVDIIILALPNHAANVEVLLKLRNNIFGGKIVAVGSFEDEINELKNLGADKVYNFFAEAGVGFAEHICQI